MGSLQKECQLAQTCDTHLRQDPDLECADLAEAIEVSAKHPIARFGVIALRSILED
jgi:hypothetical protein